MQKDDLRRSKITIDLEALDEIGKRLKVIQDHVEFFKKPENKGILEMLIKAYELYQQNQPAQIWYPNWGVPHPQQDYYSTQTGDQDKLPEQKTTCENPDGTTVTKKDDLPIV